MSGHLNEKQKSQTDHKEDHVPKEVVVNSAQASDMHVQSIEFCQNSNQEPGQINSNKKHSIKSSFKAGHVVKNIPIISTKKNVLAKEKNSSAYRDNEDLLILLGFLIAIVGLILMIVGNVLLATNPPLAQALLIVGLALFILGIITAGIGDPTIFVDVLFAILDSM